METFNFAPKDMFEAMDIADFLTYLTYTLEYRALVLEQVSYEREQKYLQSHPDPTSREEGYGVIAMDYTIRDLKGTPSFICFATYYFLTRRLRCRCWHGPSGQQRTSLGNGRARA